MGVKWRLNGLFQSATLFIYRLLSQIYIWDRPEFTAVRQTRHRRMSKAEVKEVYLQNKQLRPYHMCRGVHSKYTLYYFQIELTGSALLLFSVIEMDPHFILGHQMFFFSSPP